MKKILSIMLFFAVSVTAFSQIAVYNEVIAKDSIRLAGKWMSGITTDTTFDNDTPSKLATTKAIEAYVKGRIAAAGVGVVDSTRLVQDSILVYYQNGSEVGRDTIPISSATVSSGDSTVILATYAALDAYNGAATKVILNNSMYGGIWLRDDAVTVTTISGGVARTGVSPRRWKRQYIKGEGINIDWWAPTANGVTNDSRNIQNAISYAVRQFPTKISFGQGRNYGIDSLYIGDSTAINTIAGLIIEGNGATLTMRDTNKVSMVEIDGLSKGRISNLKLIGTAVKYNGGKGKGIRINNIGYTKNFWIDHCDFDNFQSQAIYVEETLGSIEFEGIRISACTFYGAEYDVTTSEQYQVYFLADAEYSTIQDNECHYVPGFVKMKDGANSSISNNVIESCNALNGNYNRAVIFIDSTTSNGGKLRIINNTINHCQSTQPAIYIRNADPSQTNIISGNNILVHGKSGSSETEQEAVYLDNASAIITDNYFWLRNAVSPVIFAKNTTGLVIDNNVLRLPNSGNYGIQIQSSKDVRLGENIIFNGLRHNVDTTKVVDEYKELFQKNNPWEYYLLGDSIVHAYAHYKTMNWYGKIPVSAIYYTTIKNALDAIVADGGYINNNPILHVIGNNTIPAASWTATSETIALPTNLTINIHDKSRLTYPRSSFHTPSFTSTGNLSIIQENPLDTGIIISGSASTTAHFMEFSGMKLNLKNLRVIDLERGAATWVLKINTTSNTRANIDNCNFLITPKTANDDNYGVQITGSKGIVNIKNSTFQVGEVGDSTDRSSVLQLTSDSAIVNISNSRFERYGSTSATALTYEAVLISNGFVNINNSEIIGHGNGYAIEITGLDSLNIKNSLIDRRDAGLALTATSAQNICLHGTEIIGTTHANITNACSNVTNNNVFDFKDGFTINGTGSGIVKWDGSKYAPGVELVGGDLLNGGNTGAVVAGSNNSTLELESNGVTGLTMNTSQALAYNAYTSSSAFAGTTSHFVTQNSSGQILTKSATTFLDELAVYGEATTFTVTAPAADTIRDIGGTITGSIGGLFKKVGDIVTVNLSFYVSTVSTTEQTALTVALPAGILASDFDLKHNDVGNAGSNMIQSQVGTENIDNSHLDCRILDVFADTAADTIKFPIFFGNAGSGAAVYPDNRYKVTLVFTYVIK